MKYLKKFNESLSPEDIVFDCKFILSDFIDEYDGDLKVRSFLLKDNRINSEGNYNNPDIPGISIDFDDFSQKDMLNLLDHIDYLNDFLEENDYFLEDIPGEYSGEYDKEYKGSLIDEVKRAIKGLGVTNLQLWYEKKPILEKITIDVEEGDTVYMGRFKNKKTVIKKIDKDETGMPTINGKKVVTFRIQEPKKNPNFKGYRNRFKRKKLNETLDVGNEDIILLLNDNELIKFISFDSYSTLDDCQKIIGQLMSNRFRFLNLFNDDGDDIHRMKKAYDDIQRLISKNAELSITRIDFYHPKRIRSYGFNYFNYIKSVLKNILRPIQTMDIECFIGIDRINYMDDPIANIYIILVNAE